jgi:hypothetical protein
LYRSLGVVLAWCLLLSGQLGRAATINFDSLADSIVITNQFAGSGAVFQNTIVLTAGLGLNEIEFPPHSGTNVAADNGGPISVTFSTPQTAVSAYLTYTAPITISAFDLSNNSLGSVSSPSGCPANFTSSGCTPNLFLELVGIGPISTVTITGNSTGGSFVMDDLTFSSVPEPFSTSLVFVGFGVLFAARCRARR